MASIQFKAMGDKKRYLNSEDIDRVLARLIELHPYKKNDNFEKLAVLYYFLFRTGRRVGEIVGLKPFNERTTGLRPVDIDFKDNTYRVSIIKKNVVRSNDRFGKPRDPEKVNREKFFKKPYYETFALHPELPEVLKDYIKRYDIGPLERLFPFSSDYPSAVFRAICRDLGITLGVFTRYDKAGNPYQVKIDPGVHVLRHSFAINFIKKDNKLTLLKQILAHSSLEVTQSYLRFGKEDERAALNKLVEK